MSHAWQCPRNLIVNLIFSARLTWRPWRYGKVRTSTSAAWMKQHQSLGSAVRYVYCDTCTHAWSWGRHSYWLETVSDDLVQ